MNIHIQTAKSLTPLAAFLRRERSNRGYSQKNMADFLGVKKTTYSHWEKDRTPKIEVLKSIADKLGVSLEELSTKANSSVDPKIPQFEKDYIFLMDLDRVAELNTENDEVTVKSKTNPEKYRPVVMPLSHFTEKISDLRKNADEIRSNFLQKSVSGYFYLEEAKTTP